MTQPKITILLRRFGMTGGPAVFRNRLFKALGECPKVTIRESPSDKYNVELSFISLPRSFRKPIVVRVDGCYYLPKQLKNNKPISQALAKADCVIFQSEFSRKMCLRILKRGPKLDYVIHNGIDFSYVDAIPAAKNIEPGSLVCCAGWRHNKRLKSIVHGFLHANTGRHLYVIGKHSHYYSFQHPTIHWLGDLTSEKALSVMKACSYLIHLCHIDSCPNTVIEGLACGLPVLCTNLGGTKEIVGDRGVVLPVDRWDFLPKDFNDLDNLTPDIVAAGIHQLMKGTYNVTRDHLDMRVVAQKYATVCRAIS